MSTNKKSKFIDELLEYIKDIGYIVPGLESPYEYVRRLRRSTYYGTLRRLQNKKLIVKKMINNNVGYVITSEGYKLLNERAPIKKRKDGFSTVVVFDIPEEKSRARRGLRRYLKNHGFRILQKSVYISNNKVPGSLITLVDELKLNSHVSVIGGSIEYYS